MHDLFQFNGQYSSFIRLGFFFKMADFGDGHIPDCLEGDMFLKCYFAAHL